METSKYDNLNSLNLGRHDREFEKKIISYIICKKNIMHITLPRSNSPARNRPVRGSFGDFVEAVFQPEIFRIFSNAFRPVPTGKHRKLTGIHRKKFGQFPPGILLPCSSDFQCFPAAYGDFLESFLQDPVARIIGLGI